MDYFVLSLPEASSLYLGLAIQTLLRQSSLRHLVWILVLGGMAVLVWRHAGRPHALRPAIAYLATSLVLCILFWPNITPFTSLTARPLAASQVASFSASQDDGASVITAADTQ